MGLELDLEERIKPVLAFDGAAPPGVQLPRDCVAAFARRSLVHAGAEQHEQRIRVPVDHGIAAVLDQVAGAANDLVTAPRDAARKARIVEAAARRSQDSVEGVHENLGRLRHRRVAALLRAVALFPD